MATLEELKPGDFVEAIGLTDSNKDLNGTIGVLIKRYSKKNGGRLEVKFTELKGGAEVLRIVALDPENSCVPGGIESQKEKLKNEKEKKDKEDREKATRGRYVEVFGLESDGGRALNGQRGVVVRKIEASGRIEVCYGADAKLVSLKPERLRVVVGAPAEEVAAAKEVAGPALRAALEELQKANATANESTATATPTPQMPERERSRSRSWSPPPETRQAATAAALQAASAAAARGLSSAQAEAFGQAAAEKTLQYARQVAMMQKKAAMAQQQFSQAFTPPMPEAAAADAARGNVPSVSSTAAPKVQKRAPPKSVAVAQTGDTLEAFGLKGEPDEGLNGDKGVIKHIYGFGPRTRFVMRFTQFIIDENGDLGEKERDVTLSAENLRLPGTGVVNEDGMSAREDVEKEKEKEVKKKSRSKSNGKVKQKTRSKSRGRRKKSKSRSRSRRRSRRSRSRRK